MKVLVFDTETTGLYRYKMPVADASQPYLVQLGAKLFVDGRSQSGFCLLVKPDGYEIPKDASDIHGITNEMANEFGLPLRNVLALFLHFFSKVDLTIGHNIAFDQAILTTALARIGASFPTVRSYCTMLNGTNLCRLPGKYGRYKWPKLSELHEHLFGVPHEGAHDAMMDLDATMRCYRRMVAEQEVSGLLSNSTPLQLEETLCK